MNPMLTRFPESVRIDGVRYPLNTDFRVGLRIMSAYEDPQLTRFERQVVLCRLLYQEQLCTHHVNGIYDIINRPVCPRKTGNGV